MNWERAALSSIESDNEDTGGRYSNDSNDEDNENDKWDLNETLRESLASSNSLAEIGCNNCGHKIDEDHKFCAGCSYQLKFECVGKINGKPCPKLVSRESKFCTNCVTTNARNMSASSNSLAEIGCNNCGHKIDEDHKFCAGCSYQLKFECVGKINGKPCPKLVSRESKFCTNCGTENVGNMSVIKESHMKMCCTRCGHYIYQTEKFCGNCSHQIEVVCLGKLDGNQCSQPINSEVRFCSNCGTTNPGFIIGSSHSKNSGRKQYSIPSEVSIKYLESMGFSRDKAIESLQCTGGEVQEAIEWLLKRSIHDDAEMRKKPKSSEAQIQSDINDKRSSLPSYESVMNSTAMKNAGNHTGHSFGCSGGIVEGAADSPLSCPFYEHVEMRKKPTSSEEQFQTQLKEQPSMGSPTQSVKYIVELGFTEEQALDALIYTGGKVQDAINWLLPDEDVMRKKETEAEAQLQSEIKDKRSSLPSYESVMKSTAMGHKGNKTVHSSGFSGGKVDGAAYSPLSRPGDDHVEMRKKPTSSEEHFQTKRKEQPNLRSSTQSVINLMSLDFTEEQAVDALRLTNGNEQDAVIRLVSQPLYSDETFEKKKQFSEEETKDSDFLGFLDDKIQDLDEAETDHFSAPMTHLLPEIEDEDDETVIEKGVRKSVEKNILHRLKTYGGIATAKFLMLQAMKWEKEKVKIAVAGQSSTGKSSFINAIRGVCYKDKGYAQEGYGDTTLKVETYKHPKNKHIVYCDLPGYGTTTITRDKFLDIVNISSFDIFIIFFTSVPTTDDDWLVKQLQNARKPFCFARTKLDQDIENGKRMGENEITVLGNIKDAIARATESMPVLKGADIFIISNPKPFMGEMSNLIKFMQTKVTTVKFEAILFSLPAFTKDIIEKKYKDLLGRITNVAYLHAMNYSYVYSSLKENQHQYDDNIKNEITTYFKVFELDSVCAKDVPNLKHYFSDEHIFNLLKIFTNQMPGFGIRLIPIYSVIKKYKVCQQYLKKLLSELKADAYTMYMEITKHGN